MSEEDIIEIIQRLGFSVEQTPNRNSIHLTIGAESVSPPFVVDDRHWALCKLASWAFELEAKAKPASTKK